MYVSAFSQNQGSSKKDNSVTSFDSILINVYASISRSTTKEWDFEFTKHLFHKDERLIYVKKNKKGEATLTSVTPTEYFGRVGNYFKTYDFFEREIHRKVEIFEPIIHVFSIYVSSKSEDKKVKTFDRGINSIQLFNDGRKWWIVNLYWSGEIKEINI